jgi:hypothetical protein
MSDIDPLVLDLVEWIAREPRSHAEVMDAWRTSCPRLTIWEEAVERGLVRRVAMEGRGACVIVTAQGERLLQARGRVRRAQATDGASAGDSSTSRNARSS